MRTTAIILRCKDKDARKKGDLEPEELARAEVVILRRAQRESYPATLAYLLKHGQVGEHHPLNVVRPKIDEQDGLIRLKSRLRGIDHLPDEMVCPVLLHPTHPVTKLIILDVHERELHHVGGPGMTISHVRYKYWIPGAKSFVKQIISKCILCKRLHGVMKKQPIAPLPDFRVPEKGTEPFSTMALDVFGPYEVSIGRGHKRAKKFILLACCTSYRAIHLEILDSMDTCSMLMALERIIARRTRPKLIISDNGTNFVGANKELQELWSKVSLTELKRHFSTIEWRFNVPKAPHMGGVWERLVGSAKKALRSLLMSEAFKPEELHTAIIMAEGLLNNRPLSYWSGDNNEAHVFTPAHFIRGSVYNSLVPFKEGEGSYAKRWWTIQSRLDHFWGRFTLEYVSSLQTTYGWVGKDQMPAVGDIYALGEERVRGFWPLVRVEKIETNEKDKKVRHLWIREASSERVINGKKILTPGKVKRRPLHLLIPLIKEENEKQVDTEMESGVVAFKF